MGGQIQFSFDIPWCACGKPMALDCNGEFFEKDAKQYFIGISNRLSSYIHQLYLMEKSDYNIGHKINNYEMLGDDGIKKYRTEIVMRNNNDYKIFLYYSDVKYVNTDMRVIYNPTDKVLLEEDIKVFEKSFEKYMEYSETKDSDLYDEAKELFNGVIDKYIVKLYHLVIQTKDDRLYFYIVSNIYFNDDMMLMDANNSSYEFKFDDNNYTKKTPKLSLNFIGIINNIIITKNNEELVNKELNIN